MIVGGQLLEVALCDHQNHPAKSHWLPYLVPLPQLAERVLGTSATEAVERLNPDLLKPFERHNEWLGFLGESEVPSSPRALARGSSLNPRTRPRGGPPGAAPFSESVQALVPAVSAGTTPSCWSRPNMS